VPQFLLEAGYGCKDFPEKAGTIGVTQPRRVAAISTAERVAAELGQQVRCLMWPATTLLSSCDLLCSAA
jgi:HrpA-like RNA helicase